MSSKIDYTKLSQAAELNKEFKEGAEAFIKGIMPSQNPYEYPYDTYLRNNGDNPWENWLDGWEESFYADNYRNTGNY